MKIRLIFVCFFVTQALLIVVHTCASVEVECVWGLIVVCRTAPGIQVFEKLSAGGVSRTAAGNAHTVRSVLSEY